MLSLCPTAMAYGTVSNGLSASTTEVSVGDEFGVELKIPAISDPLATIEFNISFPKDAFEVVAYEKPAFATTYSTVSDANSIGRITCSDFSASGDNDLTTLQAGGTISATLKVKDTAKAGQAYKIEVTLYTVDKIDEETYDSVDCAPAGVVKTVTITVKGNTPAHEHVWSEAWSKDATHHWHDCTAAGCDAANADKNGYAAHNYNKKVTTKDYLKTAANCTDAAVYYYSCECGAIGTKTFTDGTALGHTPSTVWSKDATHHWHVCTTCNAELDKEAHKPGPEATETTPRTCTVCGYEIAPVLPHEHNYTEQVATDEHKASSATCTAKATYYYSCKCGANGTKTFEYGEPLGHSWGQHVADKNQKSPADCENPAVYYVSCGRCDARDTEKTFTYGEKLGHKGGEWQHDDTNHWLICERCTKPFSEAAHQPKAGTPNCVNDAACNVCGYVVAKSNPDIHTKIVKVEAKAATCTEDGIIAHYKCTGCGKLFSDEAGATEIAAKDVVIPAAHKLTAVAEKPSNCRVPGTAAYDKCDVCGKMFDKDGKEITAPATLPLAAHTWDTTKWLANKDGHYRECKVCGIADTVITPHTPGAEATETTPQTCTDCGYIIKPATSHKEHTKGNLMSDATSHWYACTGCSEQLEKANHTVTSWTVDKAATTTEEGLRHGNCSVCQHVVYEKLAKINNTPVNPSKPGRPSGTKTVQSGKTFDAGVGVYVGLSILSLTGSAVVIGKKRKTR